MRSIRQRLTVIVIGSLLILSLPAVAQTSGSEALTGYQEWGNSGVWSNFGFEFSTSEAITVTDLGYLDFPWNGVGLNSSHEVGIWRVSDMQLMVSGTVPAGTAGTPGAIDFRTCCAPETNYRYVSVTPMTLAPGTYIISAATYNDVFPWNITFPTMSGSLTFVRGRSTWPHEPTSLVFPNQAAGNTYSPANFQYESAALPDVDVDGIPDETDNCPANFNPLQGDNDEDAVGDVCDPDDDNDGIADELDNCPIDGNFNQSDADFDGIGDACDTTFDAGSAAQHIEAIVAIAVAEITVANPPGGNGMIAKLTGNGGVITKIANAVSAFEAGAIDLATYVSELESALAKIGSFDNQLTAKIGNGRIVEPQAANLLFAASEIRSTIENLLAAVGS